MKKVKQSEKVEKMRMSNHDYKRSEKKEILKERYDRIRSNRIEIVSVLVIFTIVLGLFMYGCIQNQTEIGGIIKKNITKNETNMTIPPVTNETKNETQIKACEELTTGKEECLIQRAYDHNNINDCKALLAITSDEKYNTNQYIKCIKTIAQLNYSYCSEINEIYERDSCFNSVVNRFGDAVCYMIENETVKKNCLLREYVANCRLDDEYKRNICNAIATSNAAFCERMQTQLQKDECYLNYSISKRENKCSNISSEGIRLACQSIMNDNIICSTSSIIQIQDFCYQYYSVYTSSCNWCDVINGTNYKDNCYKLCTLNTNSSSYCSRISTETKRDECYFNFAISKNDVLSCDKIVGTLSKKTCVQKVALADAKPNECEILLNTKSFSLKEISDCYLQVVAGSKVSFENCQAMKDGYYKDQCIYLAIKREGLATDYCAFILDSSLRNMCEKG